LVCSESYGFQLSAERLLASRAQRAQQVKTAGSPYVLAREALDLSTKEIKAVCQENGLRSKNCATSRAEEEAKRTALGKIPVPSSHAYIADATGLPEWLVELVPAMAFSTGLLVLGFVLVGYGAHGSQEQTVVAQAVLSQCLMSASASCPGSGNIAAGTAFHPRSLSSGAGGLRPPKDDGVAEIAILVN